MSRSSAEAAFDRLVAEKAEHRVVAVGLSRVDQPVHDFVGGDRRESAVLGGEIQILDAVEIGGPEQCRDHVELPVDGNDSTVRHDDFQVGKVVRTAERHLVERDVVDHHAVGTARQHVVLVVLDGVVAVAEAVDVAVILVAARQVVVAGPAAQRVFERKAVDRVVAVRRRIGDDPRGDALPVHRRAVGEFEGLHGGQPLHAINAGIGGVILAEDSQLIRRPVDGNDQIGRIADAREDKIVLSDAFAEEHEIVGRQQNIAGIVVDRVQPVTEAEGIDVAAAAAGHGVVAETAVEKIRMVRADENVVAVERVGDGAGNIDGHPHLAIGEDDLLDAFLDADMVAVQIRRQVVELAKHRQRVAGDIVDDAQVEAVSIKGEIVRRVVGKADNVVGNGLSQGSCSSITSLPKS